MATVGVVLAGCGYLDGAEIQESVLTMLALDKARATIRCMAPDIDQLHVVDHLTGRQMNERRNVRVEAARIARGKIDDLAKVSADELDALIFPGGYGVAKNLCDYAAKGTSCDVHPDVTRLVRDMLQARKPIGVLCIAPVMMAKILQGAGIKSVLTIGTDETTAKHIETMGSTHKACPVNGIVVDRKNKIVSTPAYMLGPGVAQVAKGIEKAVREVLAMVRQSRKR